MSGSLLSGRRGWVDSLLRKPFRLAVTALLLAGIAACGSGADPLYERLVRARVGDRAFDLVRYEIRVAAAEVAGRFTIWVSDAGSDGSRGQVLRYLATAQALARLRGESERLAAEGATEAEIAGVERSIYALSNQQAVIAPTIERIIESQVAAVISEDGVGWLGTPLPPPAFDFTETPEYLVLSPRDEIRTCLGVYLEPGLPMAEREALESSLEDELENTSALVTGTGGFSTWPAMLVDTAGLEWTLATVAHEWVHVYLEIYPLGRAYLADSNMTAINETAATLIGDEIGARAMARFYPELAPDQVSPHSETPPSDEALEPEFDFNEEMRLTRSRVDELLAEGRIDEAERYMEERRLFLVENGHYVRRLNQAYFAFHGSYRTGPAAPSEDPILPRLERLRAQSSSLGEFVQTVRGVSSYDDLLALVPLP